MARKYPVPEIVIKLNDDIPTKSVIDHAQSGKDNYRVATSNYFIDVRDANQDKSRFYVDTYNFKTQKWGETLNLRIADFNYETILKQSGVI